MSEIHYRTAFGEAHLSVLDWIKVIEALKEFYKTSGNAKSGITSFPSCSPKANYQSLHYRNDKQKWRDEGLYFPDRIRDKQISNAAFELGKLYHNS